MSRCKLLTLIALILMFPVGSYAVEKSLYFEEDGRNWVYAGKTRVGEETYVPENQDPDNWDEAIILHHIDASDIPLEIYYDSFMSILNEKSGNIFLSKIVYSNENELIFEWWINHEEPGAQHGWIKVSKASDGLQFFRYTTKNTENVDAVRDVWQKILKNYYLVVIPKKVSVDIDFSLDPRHWNLAGSSNINQEFFLDGESRENWTEKFTIDVFSSDGVSPYAFYYKTIQKIENLTGKEVDTTVLESDPDSITFHWTINDGNDKQQSFYKMTVLNPKLASGMLYTSKSESDEESSVEVWEEIMKKAKVKIKYDYLLENESSKETSGE